MNLLPSKNGNINWILYQFHQVNWLF